VLLVLPVVMVAIIFGWIALQALNNALSTAIVKWLANSWLNVGLLGVVLASQVAKLTRWIAHEIAAAADPYLEAGVRWISSLHLVTVGLWASGLEAPLELFRITSALVWKVIPNQIRAATESVLRTVAAEVLKVRAIPGQIVKVVNASEAQIVRAIDQAWPALTHGYLDSWNWLRRHEKALAGAIAATAGVLAYPPSLIHDLPVPFGRTVAQIRRWLRHLSRREGLGVFAAATAAALTYLGLGWLKCWNVKQVGKKVCSTPLTSLMHLLEGLAVVLGVVNIKVLAQQTYALMGEGIGEIQHFWGHDLKRAPTSGNLGDSGAPKFLNTAATIDYPNPKLGDVA
jgi:hypothetical protein